MITISVEGGLFALRAPYSPDTVDSCKFLRGRFRKRDKAWLFPATPRMARRIAASLSLPDHKLAAVACSTMGVEEGSIPITKTEPWEHQVRSFWYTARRWGSLDEMPRGGVGLALGMGCGKTKITLDLIQNYPVKKILVICPAKVVDVWPHQWKLHGANTSQVYPLSPKLTTARRAGIIRDRCTDPVHPTIIVTNYEALNYQAMRDAVFDTEWDLVVCDEIHRIKSPTGKTSKLLHKLSDMVPARLGLTGTPMPNGPLDIFASSRFLDWSFFSESFPRFRGEYAIMGGYAVNGKPVQVLGFKNEDDLAERMSQFWLQIRSEDVLDLPPCKDVMIPVELGKDSQKAFDEMWNTFVVWVSDDEEVTAANVLVKLLKAQEITGGYLRDSDTGVVHRVGTEKRDALQGLIEDTPPDEPFVVFCRFHHDLDNVHSVAKELGRGVFEVSGRNNQLKSWQEASGGEILACQISSGKEGVDMTRARYAAFFSLGFQPGEFEQARKRLDRPGQKHPVTLYHLAAKGTVDETIYGSIEKKQRVVDQILQEVRDGQAG